MQPLFLVFLVILLALPLGGAPALASLHTYHEQPGQVTHRSIQSLPDRQGLSWQAVLFRRYLPPQQGAAVPSPPIIPQGHLTGANLGGSGDRLQGIAHPA